MEQDEIKDLVGSGGPEVDEDPAEAAGEDTILGVLREKRSNISEDDTIKKDVPGYGGFLVVEYRVLPYETVSKLVNKAQKAKNAAHELAAQTDIIVQACTEFFVRPDEDSEELQPLKTADKSFGDEPVRYDPRLATAAGLKGDLNSARKIAQALFNNDVALVSHSNEVIEWMRDTEKEGDSDF